MQRDVAPAYRKLGTVDESNPGSLGCVARLGQSAQFVVIGKCEDVDAAPRGALRQFGGFQQSVRMRGVAMEVVAKHGGDIERTLGRRAGEPTRAAVEEEAKKLSPRTRG